MGQNPQFAAMLPNGKLLLPMFVFDNEHYVSVRCTIEVSLFGRQMIRAGSLK